MSSSNNFCLCKLSASPSSSVVKLVFVLAVGVFIVSSINGTPFASAAEASSSTFSSSSSGFHTKIQQQQNVINSNNKYQFIDELFGEDDHCDEWIARKLKHHNYRSLSDLAKAIVRSGLSKKTELNFEYLVYCGLSNLTGTGGDDSKSVTLKAAVEAYYGIIKRTHLTAS